MPKHVTGILVTGGAGYIGSHVVVELVAAGYRPVIVDNFSNADPAVLGRLEQLTGQKITVHRMDYQDRRLAGLLRTEQIAGVIHIAAYKAVADSVAEPLKYYQNNVSSFVSLLQMLLGSKARAIVFSSSAAVYGTPPTDLVTEDSPCAPVSPYGWSKYMDEIILRDTCAANPELNGMGLRYFNVVGGHPSGQIGESSRTRPQNLLPIIVQAVANDQPLTVYGTDYPTPDGTCLRDYIHVVDLARAHVAALRRLLGHGGGYHVYNIGTGRPTSVLELIQAFQRVNDVRVPYQPGPRRPGDPAAYSAVADKARTELGWQPQLTVDDAVRSAWQWHLRQTKPARRQRKIIETK